MTFEAVVEKIRESVTPEVIDRVKTQKVGSASDFDVIRQGDVMLVKLPDNISYDCKATTNRQLAPGTTKGSRHVIVGDGAEVFTSNKPADIVKLINENIQGANLDVALIGPLVHHNSGSTTLDHPEHGNFIIEEPSWWATVYQRTAEEEAKRRAD